MSYENLLVEIEEHVAVLRFNRPEVLNALNRKTVEELIAAGESLNDNDEVGVVVVTGEGKSFIAGADIRELKDMNEAEALGFSELGHRALDTLQKMEKPVIAAVNGFALGGGAEVALACDFILASEKAKFGFPEVGLGIFPGFGGTQRLPRLVGKARAKELILTGDVITAAEACEIGLVNRVFPPDELMKETGKIAGTIAGRGALAVRSAKSVIDAGYDTDLATGCSMERDAFSRCFSTEDQKEGMAAFLEKRPPEFKGK
jgi:enoyl-CoA hydratase